MGAIGLALCGVNILCCIFCSKCKKKSQYKDLNDAENLSQQDSLNQKASTRVHQLPDQSPSPEYGNLNQIQPTQYIQVQDSNKSGTATLPTNPNQVQIQPNHHGARYPSLQNQQLSNETQSLIENEQHPNPNPSTFPTAAPSYSLKGK